MEYCGLARVYDMLMSNVDYDSWSSFIIKHCGVRPGRRIIDAACGTGSISVRLAAAGAAVIGMDQSEEMLEVAADKARKNGRRIMFACENMVNIGTYGAADAVCCVCDGVNYLDGIKKVKSFFQGVFDILKKGGSFCFDISSSYKLKEIIAGNLFFEDYDELTYFWQNSYDAQKNSVNMELCFFVRDKNGRYERFDERHTQFIYRQDEIVSVLRKVGFSDIRCFDCYTEEPVRENTQRITFVCVK